MDNKNLDLFQVIRNGEINEYNKNISAYDINTKNEFGQSFLHEAIANKKHEIAIDLLNRTIDVNIQDERGQTVLHFISFYPDFEVATKIIDNGGNLEIGDQYGNTPLWYAVFNARGNYKLVELFVSCGADATIKNKAGRSPIDFASQIEDERLIYILKGSMECN